ncbi:MAG: flavin prenyltransferase UbiX [Myxococcota bacterium]
MAARRIIVGLTGASGALYFLRTVRALLVLGHQVDAVMSKFGLLTLREETGVDVPVAELGRALLERYGPDIQRGVLRIHGHQDQSASIASGSAKVDGMVVVPCSMKTLSGIAHGSAQNLIERAADVCLKERRPLVLVPREAPMSLIHLRNMVLAAEAGAAIVPASPAYYQKPQTFDDLGDFIAARALSLLGVEEDLFPRWNGLSGEEDSEPTR